MPSRRVLLVIALSVLVVGALASRAFVSKGDDDQLFRTEPVTRGRLVASVTATGTVNPVTTVQVGTYVSGPVQAIDADFNSRVHKGQRVAKIDPRPFELRVLQAEAAVANARAKLEKARADLQYKTTNLARNRKLRAEGIVAEDLIDTGVSSVAQTRADVALQEAEIRQVEAQLEEARVNLGYTDIVSPVDGVVVSRNVDVGQTVAASFQTPTLFVIAEDLTKMQVDANVSEADIGTVREGQAASFTVDAYADRTFTGTVVQVRNQPLNVQNVITYDVVIAADNADLALRPGMTANVSVVIGSRDDVLKVPSAALRFQPPAETADGRAEGNAAGDGAGGGSAGRDGTGRDSPERGAPAAGGAPPDTDGAGRVWLLRGGRPAPVAIEVGLSDDSFTEIRGAAVREGDQVIVAARPKRPQSDAAAAPRPPGFVAGGHRR